jgi:hypothetical protein
MQSMLNSETMGERPDYKPTRIQQGLGDDQNALNDWRKKQNKKAQLDKVLRKFTRANFLLYEVRIFFAQSN